MIFNTEFFTAKHWLSLLQLTQKLRMPERIYNPIMATGFLAMFNFQLDNTKI